MCADILRQSQPPWDFSQSKTVGFWPTLLSVPAWGRRTSLPYQQVGHTEGLSSFLFFLASFEVRPADLAGCLLDERITPQGKLSFSSALCSLSQVSLSSQAPNDHEHSHFLQNYCPLFSWPGKTCPKSKTGGEHLYMVYIPYTIHHLSKLHRIFMYLSL